MDDDTAQLVRQLSTRAGMLMEDMSAHAIQVGHMHVQELATVAGQIKRTGSDIVALADAMHVLLGGHTDDDIDHQMN